VRRGDRLEEAEADGSPGDTEIAPLIRIKRADIFSVRALMRALEWIRLISSFSERI
jgi:hypothetical protein